MQSSPPMRSVESDGQADLPAETHGSAVRPHGRPGQETRPKRRAPGPVAVAVVSSVAAAAAGRPAPWFFAAPRIFLEALRVAILPFKLFVLICEVTVSVTFAGVIAVIAAWWFKFIPDADVWAFVAVFSERIQGILKGAGIM